MIPLSLDRLLPPYVKGFQTYVPSRPDSELMKSYGCSRIHRLNNNENALGPPDEAAQVIARFAPERAALYPSGDSYHLRHRLAERFDLLPDQIVVGNGVNEIIGFVVKALCQPGDNIITADRTFAVYEWVATFSGIEARLVPLRDLVFDDDGMLEQMDSRTKVIFLCNPNNPTGTWWDEARLRRFLERVGNRCLVVLDEAYSEFVEDPGFPDGFRILRDYPNLVVFRTFSKMYGLASLRIGYLAASLEVAEAVRRTCVVYSVSALAQEAALAALSSASEGHIHATRQMVAEGKAFLSGALDGLGLRIITGEGNFVMVRVPMSDTLVHRRLMSYGVMVRTMTGFRFPNHIRVTVGRLEALKSFMDALGLILQSRAAQGPQPVVACS